jgi:hypothetical protein
MLPVLGLAGFSLLAGCSTQGGGRIQQGSSQPAGPDQPKRISIQLCERDDASCLPCEDGPRLAMTVAGGVSAHNVEMRCRNALGNACPDDPGAQVEWRFEGFASGTRYQAVIRNVAKDGDRGNSPEMFADFDVAAEGPRFSIDSGAPQNLNWQRMPTGEERATWRYEVRLLDGEGNLVGCADPQVDLSTGPPGG